MTTVNNLPDSHRDLVRRIAELTGALAGPDTLGPARDGDAPGVSQGWDVVITGPEVNDRHGTGVLLKRFFGDDGGILSIRSADLYRGHHRFGGVAFKFSHPEETLEAATARLAGALGGSRVRRILCVPYYADDARTALAVKQISGARLCTFLMDDQNICVPAISDNLMRGLLEASDLKLAISPEMKSAYERKFGGPIWYMPPVVSANLIPSRLNPPPLDHPRSHGLIIGNVWGARWLDQLRTAVRASGSTLTWYCSGRFQWVECTKEDLVRDSILPRDPLPERELVDTLRSAWFAVVPSGMLAGNDEHRFIAQLSMPSRIVYLMATSQIPILLLGSEQTAAARFVRQLGIGLVSSYDPREFALAVARITDTTVNIEMRRRAVLAAARFSDAGAAEWIWESLAQGRPIDRRFEDLMPDPAPDMSHLFAAPSSHARQP